MKSPIQYVIFDPSNNDHLAAEALRRKEGRITIHFHTEWPSVTVPATIERKILERVFSDPVIIQKMNERLAAMPPKNLIGEPLVDFQHGMTGLAGA